MNNKIPLGFLEFGNYFKLDGKRYKVGHIIKNTNGYVACISDDGKTHRIYIDTLVYVYKEQENNKKEDNNEND